MFAVVWLLQGCCCWCCQLVLLSLLLLPVVLVLVLLLMLQLQLLLRQVLMLCTGGPPRPMSSLFLLAQHQPQVDGLPGSLGSLEIKGSKPLVFSGLGHHPLSAQAWCSDHCLVLPLLQVDSR